MKDINGKIQYKGKEYPIVFNLNVMETLQDKYGSVDAWSDLIQPAEGEPSAKALKFGFTTMINEGIDMMNDESEEKLPLFTEKQVARILTEIGFANATSKMKDVIIESTKDDSEKNA